MGGRAGCGPAGDGGAAGYNLRTARQGFRHRYREADPAGADGGNWRGARGGRLLLRGQRRGGDDSGGHGE